MTGQNVISERISDAGAYRDEMCSVFRSAFSADAGEEEGARIARLVRQLIDDPGQEGREVFAARAADAILAAILFTPLHYDADGRQVRLLSPVAVRPSAQRQGVGSALIRFGLSCLRDDGIDVVMTYGDPAYHGRFGFMAQDVRDSPPPMPLSMPHGWLARTSSGAALSPLAGECRCVSAFNDPSLW